MVLTSTKPTASELDEMAALTGYQANPTNPTNPTNEATGATATIPAVNEDGVEIDPESGAALLDPEDLEADDATPHRLWNSPWSKMIFVGLFLGIGAFAVGLAMFGFQSKWSNSHEPTAAPQVQPPPKPDAQFAPPSPTGDLKTKEALSRQATALDQTTDSVSAAPGTPGTPGAVKTPGAPGSPSATASKPGAASAPMRSPEPIPYSAPTPTRYSAPIPAPVQASFRSSPPRYSAPAATSGSFNHAPPADPMAQWQSAVTLGSYGQVSYTPPPSFSPAGNGAVSTGASAPDAKTGVVDASNVASNKTNASKAVAGQADPARQSDYQQSLYEADASAILSGAPSQVTNITAGTTAPATLSTPVVWAQDLDNSQQPQRFGIQLTQPLLSANGSAALPAGSQMVAQVDTISGSGLVELSIQAVVEPTANGNRLVSVPPGALLIQGKSGKPLMAQNYHHGGGGIGHLNTQVALVGALGKVGELLNRPSNSSTVSSPYISSTSTSNGNTNIIGGLLEGGFDSLRQQTTQQDQQEMKDILSRPNVWYVPAGADLQVFANSSFEVAR